MSQKDGYVEIQDLTSVEKMLTNAEIEYNIYPKDDGFEIEAEKVPSGQYIVFKFDKNGELKDLYCEY